MNNFRIVLIFCFLFFALAPLAVMQLYSIKVLEDSAYGATKSKLEGLAEHKVYFIENEFEKKQQKLKAFAQKTVVVNAMSEYDNAYKLGINHELYQQAEEKFFPYFNQYLSLNNDYDIFLIDTKGNIVFTVAKESDLNSNLYTGPYKQTALAEVYRKVLKEYDVSLSNIEPYEPSNNLNSLFIATPIFKNNKLVGVLAAQVDNQIINTIAKNYIGLGNSGETLFLKKQDNYAVVMNDMRHLKNPAFTRYIHNDLDEHNIYHAALNSPRAFSRGFDMEGKDVFAYWQPINNTTWAVVVQIDVEEVLSHMYKQRKILIVSFIIIFIAILLVGYYLAKIISSPIQAIAKSAKQAAEGDFNVKFLPSRWREIKVLSSALQSMLTKIESTVDNLNHDLWLRSSVSKLAAFINSNESGNDNFGNFLSSLSHSLGANAAVLYSYQDFSYSIVTFYGGIDGQRLEDNLNEKHGVLQQISKDKEILWLKNYDDSLVLETALNKVKTSKTLLFPVINGSELVGVLELAWLDRVHDSTEELLIMLNETLAMSTVALQQKLLVKNMLDKTLEQAEELKNQKASLESTNDELQQKSRMLEVSMKEVENKSKEVERASQYKSDFLANMSHELRTPLNSMLILANSLAENDNGNLDKEEVESAEIVYESGKQLLSLINDILDLSKIESGKMELNEVETSVYDLVQILTTRFKHMVQQKGLTFSCHIAEKVPRFLLLDDMKLSQILTNLISNAVKFTEQGNVKLEIDITSDNNIVFSVRDDGIGIAEDKVESVFHAFQQADSSTSRSYGGTGLGLSIVKQYVDLMEGEVNLESQLGVGSIFTVALPLKSVASVNEFIDAPSSDINHFVDSKYVENIFPLIVDDKNNINDNQPTILIIEDDPVFAKILLDVCRSNNCNAIVEFSGENLTHIIENYTLDAVISDYMLPETNGTEIIKILKNYECSRDVPIHIISALDNLTPSQVIGSVGRSVKPVNIQELNNIVLNLLNKYEVEKTILVIEDNDIAYKTMNASINSQEKSVVLTRAKTGAEAKTLLSEQRFGCIIIDLGLPDCFGGHLLAELEPIYKEYDPHIIIYSAGNISGDIVKQLHVFTDTIITKSGVNFNDLLDAVHRFVHELPRSSVVSQFDKNRDVEIINNQQILSDNNESKLSSVTKLLLVDDQMKNTFALAKVLRKKNFEVEIAPGGQEAIDKVISHGDFDLILMDIMMPEIDGYEATKIIRKDKRFIDLPIIAVTANAMSGDREKCLAAGMNDYISKPVDIDLLMISINRLLQ